MSIESETATTAPTEIELKFTIDPTDLAVFRNLPFLTDLPAKRTSMAASYFDTADHALHRAGYALRLRRSAEGIIQTLKGPSTGVAGLFARTENECLVSGEALDDAMLEAALPADLRAATAGRLVPLFTVDVERSEWRVSAHGGVVSVSVDQGSIQAGDRQVPVNEVEFELKSGSIETVFALAGTAIKSAALHLQPLGKSERGYRLLGTEVKRDDRPFNWPTASTLAVAIRRMLAELVEAIATERETVLATADPEAVHRLRVLLRRLRCLLDVASETMPTPKLGRLSRTARRAFRRLGTVRDLDILTAAVPQNAESADGAMLAIDVDRQHAIAKARRQISSRRFSAAMLELLALSQIDKAASAPELATEPTIDDDLRQILSRRWRSIKRSRQPSKLSPRARHRLRIDVKTFRYTTDFFGDFFTDADDQATKRRRKADDAVRDLQTFLGRLNDRLNIERLARDHLGKSATKALGLTAAAPDPSDLDGADSAFQRLVGQKRFWL